MIGGIITLVTLIFLRFQDRPASLTLNSITLPQGLLQWPLQKVQDGTQSSPAATDFDL